MKLIWTEEPFACADHSFVGRLPVGLPAAHFAISPSTGGFALSGSFIPDVMDGEEHATLDAAKEAAQGWLDSWIRELTYGWKTPRPKIVCLCGSTRFGPAFQEANLKETLAGNIVLTIGCDMRSDAALGLPEDTKERLDELHRRKIDLADEVLILNCNGYIGQSTQKELDYAIAHGKGVRFLESGHFNAGPEMRAAT